MILNPEYYNDNNIVTFKGDKVRIFPSTRFGNTVSGDILNGPDEGKMTTVFLDQVEKYMKDKEFKQFLARTAAKKLTRDKASRKYLNGLRSWEMGKNNHSFSL